MKNIIENERKKLNLSREELANLVQVSRQTIYFLETNKYNPSLQLAYKIAKQLNKPIEELFIFEDE
ncbi:helix-turn-helix transcriptional regulator [Kurthia huakuii]|uniref:helix-turn-helix transcriptional regulator n=1 Tax=Kurthia huakuii TaxID=1421019 RepID=UPI00049503D2|nr:helix-turn-helix transcriptional regulator [Kurthia huakuii]MBM7700298.1 putative transcriptional regulator [Kurthia huakuii]